MISLVSESKPSQDYLVSAGFCFLLSVGGARKPADRSVWDDGMKRNQKPSGACLHPSVPKTVARIHAFAFSLEPSSNKRRNFA